MTNLRSFWIALLILTALGSIIDGFTTMITLLSLFREANILAYSFAVLGSIFVYVFTANHSILQDVTFPNTIKLIAIISIGIDVLTSFVGTTYFVAMGFDIGSPIEWTNVGCCNWADAPRTIAAFGLAFSFNISTISIGQIWKNISNR